MRINVGTLRLILARAYVGSSKGKPRAVVGIFFTLAARGDIVEMVIPPSHSRLDDLLTGLVS